MSLAWCQIYPIDVNFHLQKSLEIFNKNSTAKNLIQKGQGGGKCPASCQLGLMHSANIEQISIYINDRPCALNF